MKREQIFKLDNNVEVRLTVELTIVDSLRHGWEPVTWKCMIEKRIRPKTKWKRIPTNIEDTGTVKNLNDPYDGCDQINTYLTTEEVYSVKLKLWESIKPKL